MFVLLPPNSPLRDTTPSRLPLAKIQNPAVRSSRAQRIFCVIFRQKVGANFSHRVHEYFASENTEEFRWIPQNFQLFFTQKKREASQQLRLISSLFYLKK